MSESKEMRVGRRKLTVSNLDKVLYPAAGFTKGQVIDYYARIAPVLVPHLARRPVTLKRYPDGVEGEFFYEKNCPAHRPPWVQVQAVESRHKPLPTQHCVIDDAASLVWAANLASIEMHTLLAKAPALDRPTQMVFDLDPGPPAALLECLPVAVRLRDVLAGVGLRCFAKTSGGKGLHLAVPLNTAVSFDETKQLSNALALLLERDDPERVTSKMRKELRAGRVFVDWSQNDSHKTTVCVYSLRARPRPTVSMPVTWEEIESAIRRKDASRLVFEAEAALRRVEKEGDLFAEVLTLRQKLPAVARAENPAKTRPRRRAGAGR